MCLSQRPGFFPFTAGGDQHIQLLNPWHMTYGSFLHQPRHNHQFLQLQLEKTYISHLVPVETFFIFSLPKHYKIDS